MIYFILNGPFLIRFDDSRASGTSLNYEMTSSDIIYDIIYDIIGIGSIVDLNGYFK